MRGCDDDRGRGKSSRGRGKEKSGMERGERGGRAALWLLLCRNVNTLQRSQKTMTPQGEEGVRASVFLLSACVRSLRVWGWVRQQHYGERKENDGGEMRERGREGEPTPAKVEM